MSGERFARLGGGDRPLTEVHRLLLLDLDGVVYLLDHPIEGVVEALEAHRAEGGRVVFVTNNAARSPRVVADALSGMGVAAGADEVLSSARTAASVLAEELPGGAEVLVVGTENLAYEVSRAGLRPVREAADGVRAVVQGYSADVGWRELAEATVAVRGGARWVATNPDSTLPSERGPLPGNGALIAAVRTAVGRAPDVVAGKPGPAMFRQAAGFAPELSPLVVGDRWDTDIEGAVAAGVPSMLVLSGIARAADVLRLGPRSRPTYLGRALADVRLAHPRVVWTRAGSVVCAGWEASAAGRSLRLGGSGDVMDALRALAELAWEFASFEELVADGGGAGAALRELELA